MRRICGNCKEAYEPEPALVARFRRALPDAGDATFYHGAGCDECSGSGYKGRVAVYELFPITRDVRNLVLQGELGTKVRDQAIADGMQTLLVSGMGKVRAGQTTLDEVLSVAMESDKVSKQPDPS